MGFKLRIHICTGHEVNGEEKTEDAVKEMKWEVVTGRGLTWEGRKAALLRGHTGGTHRRRGKTEQFGLGGGASCKSLRLKDTLRNLSLNS